MALSPTRVSPEPCSTWPSWATADPSAPTPRADGPLSGGTANRGLVIRVGDTVLRPTAPCWRATHALLDHLAAAGFDGAPRVLAAGPSTETLTYIDGRAAAGRPGHRRQPAGPCARAVPDLPARQRPAPRRPPPGGRGGRGQPRLDVRDRHRGGRRRPPGFRRPLAHGGGTGRPGAALVPAVSARPAGRGAMTSATVPEGTSGGRGGGY